MRPLTGNATKLHEIIRFYSDKPFRYGEDCCQFAGKVIEAATGDNPMRQFDYSDEQEAERLIASFGSLESAMLSILGDPIPVSDAQDGDILYAKRNGREMACVVYKGRCVVRSKTGLMDWPMTWAKHAWCNSG